jgi:hypothetical protein
MKSYFLWRFYKVHPRCLVYRIKITHSYRGLVDGYGGLVGDVERGMIDTFGKGGSAVLTGNINYIWSQMNPYEQERVLTGKLLNSFKSPEFLAGRWIVGFSPKRAFYQAIFGMAWVIFINALIIYLVISGTTGDITPVFLALLPFTIGMTIYAFLFFKPLVSLTTLLERQPIRKV